MVEDNRQIVACYRYRYRCSSGERPSYLLVRKAHRNGTRATRLVVISRRFDFFVAVHTEKQAPD